MVLKLLVCLSFVALVAASEEFPVDETTQKFIDECGKEKNVTEEEAQRFAKQEIEATPEIKEFFMCLTQKLGVFDGMNWNREAIKKFVKTDEKMKYVEECLAKDDLTLEPRERNLVVVFCCMEKEAFL